MESLLKTLRYNFINEALDFVGVHQERILQVCPGYWACETVDQKHLCIFVHTVLIYWYFSNMTKSLPLCTWNKMFNYYHWQVGVGQKSLGCSVIANELLLIEKLVTPPCVVFHNDGLLLFTVRSHDMHLIGAETVSINRVKMLMGLYVCFSAWVQCVQCSL